MPQMDSYFLKDEAQTLIFANGSQLTLLKPLVININIELKHPVSTSTPSCYSAFKVECLSPLLLLGNLYSPLQPSLLGGTFSFLCKVNCASFLFHLTLCVYLYYSSFCTTVCLPFPLLNPEGRSQALLRLARGLELNVCPRWRRGSVYKPYLQKWVFFKKDFYMCYWDKCFVTITGIPEFRISQYGGVQEDCSLGEFIIDCNRLVLVFLFCAY